MSFLRVSPGYALEELPMEEESSLGKRGAGARVFEEEMEFLEPFEDTGQKLVVGQAVNDLVECPVLLSTVLAPPLFLLEEIEPLLQLLNFLLSDVPQGFIHCQFLKGPPDFENFQGFLLLPIDVEDQVGHVVLEGCLDEYAPSGQDLNEVQALHFSQGLSEERATDP